jgi:hypothetical protein
MGLHRDIFWVGRQWAVTGFGVQAVDQRLKGAFDIEIARLWDDDLPQRMRALAWLKAEDFENALRVARSRFPEPPRKRLPLVESVLELIPPVTGEPVKPDAEPPAIRIEADPPLREPVKAVARPIAAGLSSLEAPQARVSRVDTSRAMTEPVAINPRFAEIKADQPLREPARPLIAPIETNLPSGEPPKTPILPAEASRPETEPVAIDRPQAPSRPLALRIEHVSAKFLPRWRIRH